MLQVPELKRAMGFDSAFVMRHGVRRDKVKMLGNAVSPPVITGILQQMCGRSLQLQGAQARLNLLDSAAA